MGLWVPNGDGDFTFSVSNIDTTRPAGSTWGTTTSTFGTAPTMGTYTQLLTATAADTVGLYVNFSDVAVSATGEDTLIDIGVDPAGGTSYSVLIPTLLASCACPYSTAPGVSYYFPVWIKAGSTIAVRGTRAGGGNSCQVIIRLVGKPRDPSRIWCGSKVTAFGVDTTNARGTVITSGTTAEGTFTALATAISQDQHFWQMGIGCTDQTMTSGLIYFADLAYGSSTTVNATIIQDQIFNVPTANETMVSHSRVAGCERWVPSGSNLYGRLQASTTPDSLVSLACWGVR